MSKENKKDDIQKASSTQKETFVSKEASKKSDSVKEPAKESVEEFAKESVSKKKVVSEEKSSSPSKEEIQLNTLFAYKVGMTHVYEKNKFIPVTALHYKPCVVTQIKKGEGFSNVQVALESSKKTNKALGGHLKKSGFKNGALFIREFRQTLPEGLELGKRISIQSLKPGDAVQVSGISKGHGFSGVVKRWGFGGGPASHGSEKHRTTGSIANTATQGRVFPGKKLPGHLGCDRITISNLKVVQVHSSEGLILIRGSVPGAQGSLVRVKKQEEAL